MADDGAALEGSDPVETPAVEPHGGIQLALLNRAGCIVSVNHAWMDFAEDNGGTMVACGPGASYLEVCDAATDEASRLVGDAIRAAVMGQMFEPIGVVVPCATPREDLWYTIYVSSRVLDDMTCIGASVAAVPLRESADPPVEQLPSPARSILDGVAVALNADVACLFVEDTVEPFTRVISTSLAHEPVLTASWTTITDELSRHDDTARLVHLSADGKNKAASAMLATVHPDGRARMTLLVVRDPARTRFQRRDLAFLSRLASYVSRQLELLEQRQVIATILDVRAREQIAKELQATTLRSLMSALASMESIVGMAQSNFAERQIMKSIHELEAALANRSTRSRARSPRSGSSRTAARPSLAQPPPRPPGSRGSSRSGRAACRASAWLAVDEHVDVRRGATGPLSTSRLRSPGVRSSSRSIASATVVASTSVERLVPGIRRHERPRQDDGHGHRRASVDLDRLDAPDRRQVVGDPAASVAPSSVEP